jgi:hypothetical protein
MIRWCAGRDIRPRVSGCVCPIGDVPARSVRVAQFLSRWMPMARAERVIHAFALTTFGVAFAFLMVLTVLAK